MGFLVKIVILIAIWALAYWLWVTCGGFIGGIGCVAALWITGKLFSD